MTACCDDCADLKKKSVTWQWKTSNSLSGVTLTLPPSLIRNTFIKRWRVEWASNYVGTLYYSTFYIPELAGNSTLVDNTTTPPTVMEGGFAIITKNNTGNQNGLASPWIEVDYRPMPQTLTLYVSSEVGQAGGIYPFIPYPPSYGTATTSMAMKITFEVTNKPVIE